MKTFLAIYYSLTTKWEKCFHFVLLLPGANLLCLIQIAVLSSPDNLPDIFVTLKTNLSLNSACSLWQFTDRRFNWNLDSLKALCIPPGIIESKSNRITQWLERTSGVHLVQSCCSSRAIQSSLLRTMYRQLLSISKGIHSSTSLEHHTVKQYFLIFRGKLSVFSLCPLFLALSADTT